VRQHNFAVDFPLELLDYDASHKHYIEFLYLCSQKPKEVIVPNKIADFMWHSHMQDNEAYKTDTIAMLGRVLNHIDDFPEEVLKKHQENT
jgi:hypothetical protein